MLLLVLQRKWSLLAHHELTPVLGRLQGMCVLNVGRLVEPGLLLLILEMQNPLDYQAMSPMKDQATYVDEIWLYRKASLLFIAWLEICDPRNIFDILSKLGNCPQKTQAYENEEPYNNRLLTGHARRECFEISN